MYNNDAENLVELKDGQRYFNGKRLLPSQMIWRCTTEGCSTPPKIQRRGQYKDKMHCNACANRIKLQNPDFLKRRGEAISKSIQRLGDKWSNVAKKNMENTETRDKISISLKNYIAMNPDSLNIRHETALKNNKISGFGTSEFSREMWENRTDDEMNAISEKIVQSNTANGQKEHLKLLQERFPHITLVEFRKGTNIYRCPQNHVFSMLGNNMIRRGICPHCSPKSKLQIDWYEWFKTEIDPKAFINKRVLYLNDKNNGNEALEVDILSENFKLAIEIHGLYFHTYDRVGDSHRIKADLADINGLELLQFFEDDLNDNPEIVKSMIRAKIGLCTNTIAARKCSVRKIDGDLEKFFLDRNHLQGSCKSFLKLGLFHDTTLCAVLTIRNNTLYSCPEIARFACSLGTRITGGFSKLLSFTIDELKLLGHTKIITYADRMYSRGKVYLANGFTFIKYTEPNMYWYKNNQRFARQESWGKSTEIMEKEGYKKILGAGNSLWEMKL